MASTLYGYLKYSYNLSCPLRISLAHLSNLMRLKASIDDSSKSEYSISADSSSVSDILASSRFRSANVLTRFKDCVPSESSLRFLLVWSNHTSHSELNLDQ